jgi:hypothetical protein
MHNLFGERFYGHRIPAWHSLGLTTQEDMTAVEALIALGGGYYFEKRPVTVSLNGNDQETGDFAIVRSATPDDATERIFGYVTKQYNIIQPLRICEIFDVSTNQPVETLGMLGKGEKIFLTWKLPDMNIKGDILNLYGFVAAGYDGKFGASLNLVKTRVVCQNTFSSAINEAESNKVQGQGKVWAGKHNSTNIERDLGIWMEHVQIRAEHQIQKEKELFTVMAETPMPITDKNTIYNLLFGIYPNPEKLPEYFPEKLRKEKQEKIDELIEKSERDADAVMSLYNGEGTAIDATAWGLFNAVTEYENWGRSTKKNADSSIMIGNRSKTMSRALDVVGKYSLEQRN